MAIRPATAADADRIRTIAGETFQSSYALSPEQIETLIETLFADAVLTDRIDREGSQVLVSERDDEIVGFADLHTGAPAAPEARGTIRWLHVDPVVRGEGVGTALFERARETLRARGLEQVHALVLAANSEATGFCEQFGFVLGGREELEVGGETFISHRYVDGELAAAQVEAAAGDVPAEVTADDATRYVATADGLPGTIDAFFPVYSDAGHDQRWGYYCANCGRTDVAVDTLGRVECQYCGNQHLPDEWDAAEL